MTWPRRSYSEVLSKSDESCQYVVRGSLALYGMDQRDRARNLEQAIFKGTLYVV
jgi:hypothetical protein